MRMASLSSGSSGNCIYIGSENHHILIDTGISKKRVEEGLKALELTPTDISGILLQRYFYFSSIRCSGGRYRYFGRPLSGSSLKLFFGRIHHKPAAASSPFLRIIY